MTKSFDLHIRECGSQLTPGMDYAYFRLAGMAAQAREIGYGHEQIKIHLDQITEICLATEDPYQALKCVEVFYHSGIADWLFSDQLEDLKAIATGAKARNASYTAEEFEEVVDGFSMAAIQTQKNGLG